MKTYVHLYFIMKTYVHLYFILRSKSVVRNVLVLIITCFGGRFGINYPSAFLKDFEIAQVQQR